MSKRREQQRQPIPQPIVNTVSEPPPVAEIVEQPEHVEGFRRCPVCWERCKGVGLVYSTQGSTRYYKCKRTLTEFPPCGFHWSATVNVVRVEYREVTLDGVR